MTSAEQTAVAGKEPVDANRAWPINREWRRGPDDIIKEQTGVVNRAWPIDREWRRGPDDIIKEQTAEDVGEKETAVDSD